MQLSARILNRSMSIDRAHEVFKTLQKFKLFPVFVLFATFWGDTETKFTS